MKKFFVKIGQFFSNLWSKIASFLGRFSRRTYETLAVLLLCAVLVVDVGYHFAQGLSSDIETMPAKVSSFSETVEMDAYLIRDEKALEETGDNILYYADDGEKVTKGTPLVAVYPDNTDREILTALETLLRAQRLLQEVETTRPEKVSEALEVRIAGANLAIEKAMLEGNVRQANREEKTLAALMLCRERLVGAADIAALLDAMKRDIAILQGVVGTPKKVITAQEAGWFSQETDGYEAYASVSGISQMDFADCMALFENKDASETKSAGRMITSYRFYAVAVADPATAQLFSLNRKYSVDLDGKSLSLTLEKTLYQNGEDKVALLFSCTALSPSLSLSRISKLSLTVEEHVGFKIPTGALAENQGVYGVYILKGFVVEFREISVTYREGNMMIAEVAPDNTSGAFKLLAENDNVVIKGEDLYDGKIVK